MERNKGTNIIEKLTDYTVIDLETTGLDPKYDEIIEFGAVRVRNGEVVETYQQLVKPKHPVDDFIAELTGITNEMLCDSPSIEAVIGDYMEFIGGDVVVGHNVNFDVNFIYDKFFDITGKEFSNDFIDTMRLARKVLKELDHHRLSDLKMYYKVDIAEAHRSVADCLATKIVYSHLWADVEAKGIDLTIIKHKSQYHIKAADILATTEPDEDGPIYRQTVVFTGTLERMVRKDAMQIVVNIKVLPLSRTILI